MVRKLKFHEQKLLKKVDLVGFKAESNIRIVEILRRYHIDKREDYTKCVSFLDIPLIFLCWCDVARSFAILARFFCAFCFHEIHSCFIPGTTNSAASVCCKIASCCLRHSICCS